jgi:hypothetical protein
MSLLRPWACWLLIAFCSVLVFDLVQSAVDIDYSHDVKGTGTVITDYRMDDQKSSQASGKIRGTGSVMNKYIFTSENDSENITITDQFVLSQEPASAKLNLADLAWKPVISMNFSLMGTPWAGNIQVSVDNQSNQSDQLSSDKVEPRDFRIDSGQLGLEANQTSDYRSRLVDSSVPS